MYENKTPTFFIATKSFWSTNNVTLGCGLPVLMKNIFDHIPHCQLTIDFWHEKPKTIIMACHSIQLNLGSTHEVQWCVTRYPKSEKRYTIMREIKILHLQEKLSNVDFEQAVPLANFSQFKSCSFYLNNL